MTSMILSGDPLKTEAFRRKLPNFSLSRRDQALNPSMDHISKDGCYFVSGKIYPFQPPVSLLLEFLLQEVTKEKGRGFSSFNIIRSAISAIAITDAKPSSLQVYESSISGKAIFTSTLH